MTYLPAKHPFLAWLGKCQTKSYKDQFAYAGVTAFDLRLFFDNRGRLEYRHGLVSYPASNLDEFLCFCNANMLTVRVIFEERNWPHLKRRSKTLDLKTHFKIECMRMQRTYPRITFYGGWNTHTHELIHDFGNQVSDKQCYLSFPVLNRIYAKLHKQENPHDAIHCYDFV